MQPTLVTWALVIFGVITLIPLILAQLSMLVRPGSQETKDLIIGKGEDWRDKTHFRMSLGAAWADWLFFAPVFVTGSIGVLLGQTWGYIFFGAAGACSLYINIILWFTEKAYVYPTRGPLKYFSYYWGFFVYWGTLALAYSVARISGIEF
ncbi:MAG: hypothetical protein HKP12_16515 [Gammaproteobacteria bacterium]|nr:hypothetical protein [Gammaproteobacteria bacterium]